MEENKITGLSINNDCYKVELKNFTNYKIFLEKIYEKLTYTGVMIKLLSYNDNKITFVVDNDEIVILNLFLAEIKNVLEFDYNISADFDNLSIVGLGFASSSTLLLTILNDLNSNDIRVYQVVASDLSLKILVSNNDTKKALELLANKYEL